MFLRSLFDHGQVRVAAPRQPISAETWREATGLLTEYESHLRQEFPGVAPRFSIAIALWATEQFYRACQLAVYRNLGADQIELLLSAKCPACIVGHPDFAPTTKMLDSENQATCPAGSVGHPDLAPTTKMLDSENQATATKHYSVDLVFRFLPDLFKLAHSAAPNDPLVARLQQWAVDWPLSSVGIPRIEVLDLQGIVEHPGLFGYYVDRVIARRDLSRIKDPHVKAAVQRSLGGFRQLAPDLAEAISSNEKPATTT